MTLSVDQIHTIGIVGRCASALSIVGIATIIVTFCLSPQFRNPIHRIIFINALFNVFDVIATTISVSGPAAGNHSALCQFQGFLMQTFPLADVLWTLVLACNVFLIVFYKYETEDLLKLEKKYLGIISFLVFVPAISFLFVHTPAKGPMFGSVTLWCSIAPHWVLFRIIFFYGPIWFTIFTVMMLYCLVGIEILKQRHIMKAFRNESFNLDMALSPTERYENTATESVQSNDQSQAMHIVKPHGKETEFVLVSKSSTSQLHPSDGNALVHRLNSRPPVSFRQYILMPLMFFIVLLAIWVAPTVNRVSAFISPNYLSYPLLLAVCSTGSLRGFWNGIVFITLGMKERKRQKKLKKTGSSLRVRL